MGSWHEITANQMRQSLIDDDSVRGLVVIGSCARSDATPDAWSDLDVAVIVEDRSIERFYPGTDWTAEFGEPYAHSLSRTQHFCVVRAQYADGRRVDFVIIPESSLESIGHCARNPLQLQSRCLFSRSPLLDEALSRTYPPRVIQPFPAERLERMANDFRFKGMLAVSKAARDELLVALHLALDLSRDCLVLAMLIRDHATGTDHHTDGGHGNDMLEMLSLPCKGYTTSDILNSVEGSAIAFDALAAQLDADYQDRRAPLLDYIEHVRSVLQQTE